MPKISTIPKNISNYLTETLSMKLLAKSYQPKTINSLQQIESMLL